jgi:hypothetical protein
MVFDEPKPARLSLGFLRKAEKTKPRSPEYTETMKLQRHTLETFIKQFKEQDADEIDCCIAAWRNTYSNGESYLSVEISPKYVSRRSEPERSDLADFI